MSSKQSLILLPGLMCDHEVWDAQIEGLSDIADARSVEWDTSHDSLGRMADAVLAGAADQFALAGHSMGGRVAFEVYRRAPQRITRLAVLNTGTAPLAPRRTRRRRGARAKTFARYRFHSQGIHAMALEWLKGMIPAYRTDDTPLVDSIVNMFERKTAQIFLIQQEALLSRPDARPILPQIHCPTLVLTGEDDKWSGPARHEQIAAAIPGSRLAIMPKCGHMSTMERPLEVTTAMRDWLAS